MNDERAVTTPDHSGTPEGYAAAMAELEAILDEIDRDDVDVDLLTTRVARAAVLIRWCRARIEGAQISVERIVAELTTTSASAPPVDAGDDEPD